MHDVRETRRITTLFGLGLLDSRRELRFDRVTRLAQRLFDVPIALVSLVDHDRQWFKSSIGLDVRETPRDISFCTHAIEGPDVMVVEDALADPRFATNPLVTDAPSIRFYAGAPLTAPDGQRIGTLCVIDRRPRAITAADRAALVELADLVDHEIHLRYLATTDEATGVRNHRGFMHAAGRTLELARHEARPVALVCVQLDGLRGVIDRWGHDEAELVMGDVATLLRDRFGSEVAGRLAGPDLAVLLDGPASGVPATIDAFRRDLAAWAADANLGVDLAARVGVAVATAADDLSTLLARADRAATLDPFA